MPTINKAVLETINKKKELLTQLASQAISILNNYSKLNPVNEQSFSSLSAYLRGIGSSKAKIPAGYFKKYILPLANEQVLSDFAKNEKIFSSIESTLSTILDAELGAQNTRDGIETSWKKYLEQNGQAGLLVFEAWKNFVNNRDLTINIDAFEEDFDSFREWTKLLGGNMSANKILDLIGRKSSRAFRQNDLNKIGVSTPRYTPPEQDSNKTIERTETNKGSDIEKRILDENTLFGGSSLGEIYSVNAVYGWRGPELLGKFKTKGEAERFAQQNASNWEGHQAVIEIRVAGKVIYQLPTMSGGADGSNDKNLAPKKPSLPEQRLSGWDKYVSKTSGGDKVKAAWESNTPSGYSKEYLSFVKWYKDTNPSFLEKNKRNLSVDDVVSLITHGKKNISLTDFSGPSMVQGPSAGLSDQRNPPKSPIEPTGEISAPVSTPEVKKITPVTQNEILQTIRDMNNNVISNVSVLMPSGESVNLPAQKFKKNLLARIRKSGGEEQVATEISSKFLSAINENMQSIYQQYVDNGAEARFTSARKAILAGQVYNAINNTWVSRAKTQYGKKLREKKLEREKVRTQRRFERERERDQRKQNRTARLNYLELIK